MKKHNRTLMLGLLFLGPAAVSSAYADESLAGLQQDIIAAKQKQTTFSTKAEPLQAPILVGSSPSEVQDDAQKLIDDMKANPEKYKSAPEKAGPLPHPVVDASAQKAVVTAERPGDITPTVPIEEPESSLSEPEPVKKKSNFWPPNFGFGYSKIREDNRLAESDALYRVAISDKKLTLDECVEIGQAASIDLAAKRKVVEVAEAKLQEAKRAMFPTVQAVAEVNGGHVPGAAGARFYKGKNQRLNVTQPLWYGGELVNAVKQAEENVKVSKTEYEKSRNDLIHTIRTAYWNLVKAHHNREYQADLYEKADKIHKVCVTQHEAKLLADVDYLNAEAQYNQIVFQSESSHNDLLSAEVVIKQLLDIEEKENLPIEIKLEFKKVEMDFDELVKSSLTNSADIRIKGYAVEAAKYGILVYKGKQKPHFDLRGSYGMLGEAFHDTEAFEDQKADNDLEREWYLGVHGTMPLGPNSIQYDQIKHSYGPTVLALTGSDDWRHHVEFNLFDRFSSVTDEKSAQSALLEAEAEYQRTRNEITLRLRDDYFVLQRAMIQVDSSAAKMKYQQKQTQILEYLISLQEASPSAVLENLIQNAQDKYAFVQAITDYNISLSSLSVAIGDPYYFEK